MSWTIQYQWTTLSINRWSYETNFLHPSLFYFIRRYSIIGSSCTSSTCSWYQWFSFNHRSIDFFTSSIFTFINISFSFTLLSINIYCIDVNTFSNVFFQSSRSSSRTLKLLPAFSHLDIFGTLPQISLQDIREEFHGRIHLNLMLFSTIARPTTGIQRTSIWGLRTRLWYLLFFSCQITCPMWTCIVVMIDFCWKRN